MPPHWASYRLVTPSHCTSLQGKRGAAELMGQSLPSCNSCLDMSLDALHGSMSLHLLRQPSMVGGAGAGSYQADQPPGH